MVWGGCGRVRTGGVGSHVKEKKKKGWGGKETHKNEEGRGTLFFGPTIGSKILLRGGLRRSAEEKKPVSLKETTKERQRNLATITWVNESIKDWLMRVK